MTPILGWSCAKFFIMYEQKLHPNEVGSSDKLSTLFFTITHVGRFRIYFFCGSFGCEIFHTCNQRGDTSYPKFLKQMIFFSPWEGVKVGCCETFLIADPMLVDFDYLWLNFLALKYFAHATSAKIVLCQEFCV